MKLLYIVSTLLSLSAAKYAEDGAEESKGAVAGLLPPHWRLDIQQKDLFTLEYLKIAPYPPAKNSKNRIVLKGNLLSDIDQATVEVRARYMGFMIGPYKFDLCESLGEYNTGLKCPIKKGKIEVDWVGPPLPDMVPRGVIELDCRVTTPKGPAAKFIGKINFTFSKNPKEFESFVTPLSALKALEEDSEGEQVEINLM